MKMNLNRPEFHSKLSHRDIKRMLNLEQMILMFTQNHFSQTKSNLNLYSGLSLQKMFCGDNIATITVTVAKPK